MIINSHKRVMYVFSFLLIALFALSWRLGILPSRTAPGLIILGVDVGRLPLKTAAYQYNQIKEDFETMPVVLRYRDQSLSVTPRELGVTFDCEKNNTYKEYGFKGDPITKIIDRIRSSIRGYRIPVSDCINLNNTPKMDEVRDKVRVLMRNAYWKINAEGDLPVESVVGQDIDMQKLVRIIVKKFEIRRISLGKRNSTRSEYITIPIVKIKPQINKVDIIKMDELSEFTTHFDPTVTGRVHNIIIAVDRILGTYMEPGKDWSLNNVVGPREKNNGFQEALVIENGEFVTGVGGGVSQVATTTYNAALKAGLGIKEHFTHTIPITYVPFGMDATAVYGKKDLVFTNTTSSLVSLTGKVSDDSLTIKIYGFPENDYAYVISPRVLETFEPKVETAEDNTLDQSVRVVDKKGLPGYRLAIDRFTVDRNGKTIKEEVATTGWYRMIPEKVRIGTKKTNDSMINSGKEPGRLEMPKIQTDDNDNSGVASTFSRYIGRIRRTLRK